MSEQHKNRILKTESWRKRSKMGKLWYSRFCKLYYVQRAGFKKRTLHRSGRCLNSPIFWNSVAFTPISRISKSATIRTNLPRIDYLFDVYFCARELLKRKTRKKSHYHH